MEAPAGYRFVTDEELSEIVESCDACQGGYTSCYHCCYCGKNCSMMGHAGCPGIREDDE